MHYARCPTPGSSREEVSDGVDDLRGKVGRRRNALSPPEWRKSDQEKGANRNRADQESHARSPTEPRDHC